jgi:phage shock protein PspC (stress-responsive transcriptional regulator)
MPTKRASTNQSAKSESSSQPASKRLYRSETDRMIAGVCGGLGEYFNLDANVIRLIFVLVTLAGGSGVFVYIILWLVLPSQSYTGTAGHDNVHASVTEIKAAAHNLGQSLGAGEADAPRNTAGIVLLLIGAFFLLGNFGLFRFISFHDTWPLLLIGLGLIILYKK